MPDELAGLIDEVRERVAALGLDVVDLRKGGTPRRARLQVRIDRPDAGPGQGITVDDCALVSRALEQWLDGSGLLGSNYVLEVSSPGIERPVRWRRDWERFAGREVSLRLMGRGRCRATIVGVVPDQEAVTLRLAGGREDITVPIADIRDATLVVDWHAIETGRRET
jgi:ribosome maturation factor RimP